MMLAHLFIWMLLLRVSIRLVVKGKVIYGANASGKSNLLAALMMSVSLFRSSPYRQRIIAWRVESPTNG